VIELLADLSKEWGFDRVEEACRVTANIPFHEAGLLKLNCDKALLYLKWECNLHYEETIRFVGEWYAAFYRKRSDMYALTLEQIAAYERSGFDRRRIWSRA